MLAAFFDNLLIHLRGGLNFWTIFGLVGNTMFTSRFIVQWYVSEKLKKSVIPKNFWHFSLIGGSIMLIYGLHDGHIPIILGYLTPPMIAARNLVLIARQENHAPPTSDANKTPLVPPAPDDDATASMLATHEAVTR